MEMNILVYWKDIKFVPTFREPACKLKLPITYHDALFGSARAECRHQNHW